MIRVVRAITSTWRSCTFPCLFHNNFKIIYGTNKGKCSCIVCLAALQFWFIKGPVLDISMQSNKHKKVFPGPLSSIWSLNVSPITMMTTAPSCPLSMEWPWWLVVASLQRLRVNRSLLSLPINIVVDKYSNKKPPSVGYTVSTWPVMNDKIDR